MFRAYYKQLIITAGILGLSLVTLFILIPTQIEQELEYDLASLSPTFFPELAALTIGGLALVLLISQIRRAATGKEPLDEGVEELTSQEEFSVVKAMVVAVVYFFLLEPLGFPITNTLGVAALLRLQGRVRGWKMIALPIGTTAGIYLFFLYVMRVHFPMGKIFG